MLEKENNELRIAVISDLHCYHAGDKKWPIDSYLTSDKLRTPIKDHPVEALLEVIRKENIIADFLLCPGDVANKADQSGFIGGWNYILEMAEALNATNKVIATLGNHDVDSRLISTGDIYNVAKGIKKGFPLNDKALCEKFWSSGFVFYESIGVRFLVLNSVSFHNNQNEIERGKVSISQLEEIESYLNENIDNKLKIAMCHHHPLPHERFNLGAKDVIENGTNLIDLLNKYKFELLIHGHKHDPWLRYAPGSNNSIAIFSAGSFSATTNLILTGKRNTFHLLTVKKDSSGCSGQIKTWEYLPNVGWKLADSGEDCFPVYSGFGYRGKITTLIQKTVKLISSSKKNSLEWDRFITLVPEVQYLTPDDCIEFRNILKSDHQIITYPSLPKLPDIIGKLFSE